MSKVLIRIISGFIYLILLTPLVIAPWFVYPFVAPKAVFFWIIAEIIFAIWAILAVLNKQYRPKESILLYSILGFVILMFLASLRGVNPVLSIFGTFERMTGLITLIHGFLIFISLSSTFKSVESWKPFFRFAMLVGAIVSIAFFLDDSIGKWLPSARLGSTLGNSSFFGSYILFPIFLSIYLFLTDKAHFRIFSFVSAILMVFALYFSSASAAFYSFVGGSFIIFLSWLFFRQTIADFSISEFLFRSKGRLIATVLLLGCLAFFAMVSYAALAQNQTILNYLPDKLSEKKIGARLVVWETAWDGITERPILGWGPENFQAAYVKYFNPCMPIPDICGGEVWFDKAHNIIIDTIVASGFSGLLAYLSIFITAIFLMWKHFLKHERSWIFPATVTALFAAYFVQNLFVFDMPTTYLMFFFALAFVGGIISKNTADDEMMENQQEKPANLIAPALAILMIVPILSISIYFIGYKSLNAAYMGYKSSHETIPNLEERVNLYVLSIEGTPLGNLQARQSFTNSSIYWLQKEIDFPNETLKTIESQAENMAQENPFDLRSHLILGNFYNAMTKYYVLKNNDKGTAQIYLDKAKTVLDKALMLSPTNQQVYLSLSQNFIFRKDLKKAEQILQAAIDLEPRYGDSHYNLGDLYIITKEFDKAAEKFDKALEFGYRVDAPGKAAQIARAYYETKQFEKAASWYEEVVRMKPNDPDARWTLALIYKELGKKTEARLQAQKVKELDAQYTDTMDTFIKNL